MPTRIHAQTIDPVSATESVLTLVSALRPERIPPGQRMTVAQAQVEAAEEWFAACMAADASSN